MRVILHGRTDDVGHLVIASVIELLHGMQDASLNRFQSILNVRHRTLQNHIRGVVQKPLLVHAGQLLPTTLFVDEPSKLALTGRADLLIAHLFGRCSLLLDTQRLHMLPSLLSDGIIFLVRQFRPGILTGRLRRLCIRRLLLGEVLYMMIIVQILLHNRYTKSNLPHNRLRFANCR